LSYEHLGKISSGFEISSHKAPKAFLGTSIPIVEKKLIKKTFFRLTLLKSNFSLKFQDIPNLSDLIDSDFEN